MPRFILPAFMLLSLLALSVPVHAKDHFWKLVSPDHEQTYAYGTEQSRVWKNWNGHLALLLNFTNDPFVDRQNSRQWDDFRFDFPNVRIGADGHTFYYLTQDDRRIPVAMTHAGFLGINEVRLLPSASVAVSRPHGYITVYLNVFAP
jgi:hypothetical protein